MEAVDKLLIEQLKIVADHCRETGLPNGAVAVDHAMAECTRLRQELALVSDGAAQMRYLHLQSERDDLAAENREFLWRMEFLASALVMLNFKRDHSRDCPISEGQRVSECTCGRSAVTEYARQAHDRAVEITKWDDYLERYSHLESRTAREIARVKALEAMAEAVRLLSRNWTHESILDGDLPSDILQCKRALAALDRGGKGEA